MDIRGSIIHQTDPSDTTADSYSQTSLPTPPRRHRVHPHPQHPHFAHEVVEIICLRLRLAKFRVKVEVEGIGTVELCVRT